MRAEALFQGNIQQEKDQREDLLAVVLRGERMEGGGLSQTRGAGAPALA